LFWRCSISRRHCHFSLQRHDGSSRWGVKTHWTIRQLQPPMELWHWPSQKNTIFGTFVFNNFTQVPAPIFQTSSTGTAVERADNECYPASVKGTGLECAVHH
jgi:hypothetical protein